MAIAVASISTYVYKYVIHKIAISYAAWISTLYLYLYLYCIYIVLLYIRSTCSNKMRIRFTILFHLKTMTATTFNTYQVWECLLGSPPYFVHNMTAPNFSSIQPEIGKNQNRLFSHLLARWRVHYVLKTGNKDDPGTSCVANYIIARSMKEGKGSQCQEAQGA